MISIIKNKLVYILIPIILVTLFSCEKNSNEDVKLIEQEVVVVKIPPIEQEQEQDKAEAENVISQAQTAIQSNVQQPEQQPASDISVKTDEIKIAVSPSKESSSQPESKISDDDKTKTESITSNQNNLEISLSKTEKPEIEQVINTENKVSASSQTDISKSSLADNADNKVAKTDGIADTPEVNGDNEALLSLGNISGELGEEKLFYNEKGKIDPFEPLIKEKAPVEEIQETFEEDIPERILTPLEKLDFGQIRLVAILTRASGSVAMVQEATGKGYIVNIGTYMGRNSGQVVSIEKDKLVILEKVKDYRGNVVDSFQELKLKNIDDKG